MIFWLALFLIVLAISFLLAYSSMKDYQEIPKAKKEEYGLFLIRNTEALKSEILSLLHGKIVDLGLIVSIERLFKGKKSALVIFGPKKILQEFSLSLDLLELEDYTKVNKDYVSAWEVGEKIGQDIQSPELEESEQFWWQVTLQAKKDKEDKPKTFYAQVRAVIFSQDPQRRKILSQNLPKVPRPFTSSQILQFFRQRSLSKNVHPNLSSEQIVEFLKFT